MNKMKESWFNVILLCSMITIIIIIFNLLQYFGVITSSLPSYLKNLINIGVYVLMFSIAIVFIFKTGMIKKVGFNKKHLFKNLGIGFLGGSGFLIAALIFMQPPVFNFANLFYLLILSLLIGLTEETIFRGYVQQELKNHYKPIIAVLITAILFAALHMPRTIFDMGWFGLAGMVSFTMIGLIIGLYRRYLESLSGVIILHAFWDYWLLIFVSLEEITIDMDEILELLPLLLFLLTGIGLAFGFLMAGLLISWKFVDHSETDYKETKRVLDDRIEEVKGDITEINEMAPLDQYDLKIKLILEEKMLDIYNMLINNLSVENVKTIKKSYRLNTKIINLAFKYYTGSPALRPIYQNKIKMYQEMLGKKDEEIFSY